APNAPEVSKASRAPSTGPENRRPVRGTRAASEFIDDAKGHRWRGEVFRGGAQADLALAIEGAAVTTQADRRRRTHEAHPGAVAAEVGDDALPARPFDTGMAAGHPGIADLEARRLAAADRQRTTRGGEFRALVEPLEVDALDHALTGVQLVHLERDRHRRLGGGRPVDPPHRQ